jgi:putative acetyltransferase
MAVLQIYRPELQQQTEVFFEQCICDLGWTYEPHGRHRDITGIKDAYMQSGCFWCLFDSGRVVGTVAVREIVKDPKTAEIKRLYVSREYQGRGYGRLLFDTVLQYAKGSGYSKVCVDTRRDRDASLHLIRKNGFKEIPKYNDNAFAELFFELKL